MRFRNPFIILLPLMAILYFPVESNLDGFNVSSYRRNSPFSSPNFIVLFSSEVREHSATYNVPDLLPMVQKFSSEFSSILTPLIQPGEIVQSVFYTVEAIALFNTALMINRLNTKISNPAQPLELFMLFDLDKSEESKKGNDTIAEDASDGFDNALQLAEMASGIFSGITRYIIGYTHDLDITNSDEYLAKIIRIKSILNSNFTSYKLGAISSFQDCGYENLERYLTPLLKHLDLVGFIWYPNQEELDDGPQVILPKFLRKFNKCKSKVHAVNPAIEVSLNTGWPDTDTNGKRNYSNQAFYWEELSKWAQDTKTKVFMEEAFDNSFREGNYAHRGWWALKTAKSFEGPADFEYEDKRELARKEKAGKLDKPKKTSRTVEVIVASAVTSTVVILAVVAAGIYFLHKKIKKQKESMLSKEEIEEFFEGVKRKGSNTSEPVSAEKMAYDKNYEVDITNFITNEEATLGSGSFGRVVKGIVIMNGKEVNVAVKMLNKFSPSTALNGLLSEIKVLSYLGKHENILSLVGAYTEGLRKGKVYVFTELCGNGSLERYLRSFQPPSLITRISKMTNKNLEKEPILHEEVKYVAENTGVKVRERPNAARLKRWAYEIANGMEFLASKYVVHADLATRNVLLTEDFTAKISDFGLSRRMYDYTNYVKTQQEPLPWRWMSPEALRRLEFNEKTDVWAFGVTLWEIYSFGDLPYPGLHWTQDFPTRLMNGLRLEEPEFNTDSMYSLMLMCWSNDPATRPTFKELKGRLAIE